jgi:pyruvate formate lyase activating enzyme
VKTAEFFRVKDDGTLQCLLCPHFCTPAEGKTGKCGVRRNVNGELVSETYRKVSAIHYDPIEKKPLYHFYPGSIILSIGSVGCNLSCSFCQNCDISRADVSGFPWYKDYGVEEVVTMASDYPGNIGIAFTYNEPTMSYEYIMEVSRLASSMGMKTAMVTNGFINPDPLIRLLPFVDAYNVDLKAFRDEFYIEQTRSHLAPVMETLRILKEAGKHFEITNLVIPGLNDDRGIFSEMVDWIAGELGEYSILHISRYFPHHKMTLEATPVSTLLDLYGVAREKLHYVYLGNVVSHDGQNTFCPECGELLINRNGYRTKVRGLTSGAKCATCNTPIQNILL